MAAVRRRRRRPPWALFAVVATALVLLVNALVNSRSSGPSHRLAELAYLDTVRPQVEHSNDQGADVDDVRNSATKLGRDGIDKRLARLERESTAVYDAVAAANPPRSLRASHSLLVATLFARSRGAALMHQALRVALAAQPAAAVVDQLTAVGDDLVTGDRDYKLFLETLPHSQGASQAAMPASTWVRDPTAWSGPVLGAFITTLQSSTALAPVHDTAVVLVTTDPTTVAKDPDGTNVLPEARVLTLQIVVADVGNEPERHLTVTAGLAAADGSGQVQSVRDFVDLVPGQRLTVQLGGLRLTSNLPLILTVNITTVDGETNGANNTQSLPLIVKV
jgi:hypothetical protein